MKIGRRIFDLLARPARYQNGRVQEKAGKQDLGKKEKTLTIFQGLIRNKLTMLENDNID
jgi:hypothetical protein